MGVCSIDIPIGFGFGYHNLISEYFSGVHVRAVSIN